MTATDTHNPSCAAPPGAPDRHPPLLVAAVGALAIGVVFSAFVAFRMISAHSRMLASNPETAAELLKIRDEIARRPDDASLGETFRQREVLLRGRYMRALHVISTGRVLLAGGLIVALAGAVTAVGFRNASPRFAPPVDARTVDTRTAAIGRWGTLAVVVALFAAALGLIVLSDPAVALKVLDDVGPAIADDGTPAYVPDPKDLARYWARFRGPGGAGTSAYANIPTDWDGATDKGVLWKTPLPLKGKSSPVLWGKRMFLTAADKARRLVVCIDVDTGKEMWQCTVSVPGPPAAVPHLDGETGYAPCGPVTDGRHVVAMFPNGDLVGVDYEGRQLWAKNLGLPDNGYGHAASLEMWQDKTLVLFDQGGLNDGKSRLLAFSSATGRLRWARPRPVASSWATPVVVHAAGKDQLITSADPWVISYDPTNGKEIWRARVMSGDVASSPILAGGMVFVVHESADLVAIRPDGTGDVTKTHVAWKAEEGLPDITSPVSNGKQIWLVTSNGDLTCYDVKTGKMLYLKELDGAYNASPSVVGDQVWLMNAKGVTQMIAAGPEYKLLHTTQLGEHIYASPVFADGRLYIRGNKTLYCIGAK